MQLGQYLDRANFVDARACNPTDFEQLLRGPLDVGSNCCWIFSFAGKLSLSLALSPNSWTGPSDTGSRAAFERERVESAISP